MITGVVIRRAVDDLASALAFYEALTGEAAHRFRFAGAELAAVGPFLLLAAGADRRVVDVAATITVDDLPAAHDLLVRLAAQIVAPATATPNGYRLLARHPDGAVFEYVSRQREPR